MRAAIQAVYDGRVFIPVQPCGIERGSEVTLTIETANDRTAIPKKLNVFRQLTSEIAELNRADPPKRFKLRELSGR